LTHKENTMSFTPDQMLDPETVLRLVDLACETTSGQDLALLLENKGSPIEGESTRDFEDGKKRLDALGYILISSVQVAPGTNAAKVSTSNLIVVRKCDAASASIASLLKSQTEDLRVVLSTFKAGGESYSTELQPTLEMEIDKGRVAHFSVLTSGRLQGVPCEIVAFAHQEIEIRSAPQAKSGQRGAVRTCTFSG
jgi:hypothetical protein